MADPTFALVSPDVGDEHRLRWVTGGFLAGYTSAETRHAYLQDLTRWYEFCSRYNIDPVRTAERAHVEVYLREVEAAGYAKATVCRRVSTLASFYSWLVIEGWREHSPVSHVRRPRRADRIARPYLSRMELTDWLAAGAALGGSAYAAACLLGLHGLRVGETCAADIDHIRVTRWQPMLHLPNRKGGYVQDIVLDGRTMYAIEQAIGDREDGPLLLNRAGNRMTRPNAARLVRRLATDARIDKHCSPHTLRRTAATLLLHSGTPAHEVQRLLGHSKISTTLGYDQRFDEPSYAALGLVAMTS